MKVEILFDLLEDLGFKYDEYSDGSRYIRLIGKEGILYIDEEDANIYI